MAKLEIFKVDGVALPPVLRKNAKYSENDLSEKAYRDAFGVMHQKVARWGVRKVELKWPRLTDDQLNLITSLVKGKENFTFEFYDRKKKGRGTYKGYSGNTLSYTLDKGATNKDIWVDVSISIIEV